MNTNYSLVSVIIPAYNHEKYVQDTIKSIIDQTYQNIELIIIDDGSKDSTVQKIEELREECEKRFINFHFETQDNSGTCSTLNKLINLANGKYIYLIASDDIAKNTAIEIEVDFLEKNQDFALVAPNNEFIDSDNNVVYYDKKGKLVYDKKKAKYLTFADLLQRKRRLDFNSDKFGSYKQLYLRNHVPNGYLIRKSIFEKVGQFTKEAPLEDLYMLLQISKYAKMKFIDKILFQYRRHSLNTVSDQKRMDELTSKTFKYEEKILQEIDEKVVLKEVLEVKRNGVCYRRKGIPYVFETLYWVKNGIITKEIKLFCIKIYSKKKYR